MQGTQGGAGILVPYWYGVPSNTPASLKVIENPPSELPVGESRAIYFRITDAVGIAVLDNQVLQYQGTVVAGGGTISGLDLSPLYPNLVYATIKMGPEPIRNTFRVSFGSFPPVTFNINGVKPEGETGFTGSEVHKMIHR